MRWIRIFESIEEAERRIEKKNPLPVQIGDRKINLIKCAGEWYATADSCPHQHASLSGGWTNHICEIICPLHEYRYDLKTGRESSGRAGDLELFPVRINNDLSIGLE